MKMKKPLFISKTKMQLSYFNLKNNPRNFVLLGLITEIVYFLFLFIEPLRKGLGDERLTLSYNPLVVWVFLLYLILAGLYWLAYQIVRKNKIDIKIILFFCIIFNITCFFVWPIDSFDIFSYVGWARVASVYNENTYLVNYNSFTNDPFFPQINNKWLGTPTPYGPVFMIISIVLSFLGKNSLLLSLYLLKAFFVFLQVSSCFLIHKIFRNEKITFLYSFNPFLIFEFAINGHNDILGIFLVILCFLFFFKDKADNLKNVLLAWFFLTLSFFVKFMTLPILPIFFIISLFNMKDAKKRFYFFFSGIVIFFLSGIILYLPFWGSWEIFKTIIGYAFTMAQNQGLIKAFPSAPSFLVIFFYNFSSLFAHPISFYKALLGGRIVFLIFYGIMLIILLKNYHRLQKEKLLTFGFGAVSLFLLTSCPWVLAWYIALPVFLGICSVPIFKEIKTDYLTIFLTFFCVFLYLFQR